MQTRIKVIREGGSGEELNVKGGVRGDIHASDYLPKYGTLVSLGKGYIAAQTAADAVLTVIPTTTSHLTIFNGEAAGGLSYIIDRIFASCWAGDEEHRGTAGLWACIHHPGQTMGTSEITPDCLDGDANYGGNAIVEDAASVDNDVWYPWGESAVVVAGDAFSGVNLNYDVEGRIVIKPTCALSLAIVGAHATMTAKMGLSWFEVQIDVA